ncbi:MAG: hypothetical protein KA715_03275 [Xanthomonadaceae bacterium]|nr:hypothetical protein [Xanthomonadaceae bacterium]
MKQITSVLIALSTTTAWSAVDQKTTVSVNSFKQKAATSYREGAGCHGWSWFSDLGNAFTDVLVEKLNDTDKYDVLERAQIGSIYESEVDLLNSEKDKSIQKGRFKKAKITFIGVVDGFEFCQNGSKVGFDMGGILGIGKLAPSLKISEATVSLMIRAVDTSTGKILATARSKKSQKGQSVGLDFSVAGVSAGGHGFKQTMLGETIQEAVGEATDELMKKL